MRLASWPAMRLVVVRPSLQHQDVQHPSKNRPLLNLFRHRDEAMHHCRRERMVQWELSLKWELTRDILHRPSDSQEMT